MCVRVSLWEHVGPTSVGLTDRLGRVNGIRLTCVIQLGCGREVCPHPSAGGDKEPGEGGWGPFHQFTGNPTTFLFPFGLTQTDLCLGVATAKRLTM